MIVSSGVVVGVFLAWYQPAGLAFGIVPAFLSLTPGFAVRLPLTALGVVPVFRSNYVTVAIVISVAILVALLRNKALRLGPCAGWIAALTLYLAASTAWSDADRTTAAVALAPTLVLLLGAVRWPVSLEQALKYIAHAGVVHAVLTLVAAAVSTGRVTLAGPFALPTLVAGGVAAVGLASQNRKHRTWWSLAAGLCLVAILITETRGMVLAFLAGAATVGALPVLQSGKARERRGPLALFLCLFASAVGIILLIPEQTASRYSIEQVVNEGVASRAGEFKAVLSEVLRAPLIGHGVGHGFYNPIVGTDPYVRYVHNSFLYFLVVGGLVGLALYVRLLIRILGSCLRNRHQDAGVVAAAVLVALLTFSLSAAVQRTPHFNIFLAAIAGSARERRSASPEEEGSRRKTHSSAASRHLAQRSKRF